MTSHKMRDEQTRKAVRGFFGWLESKYGGLVLDRPNVATKQALERQDLVRLMNHDLTAIHVKGFYPKHAARELGKALALESETKRRIWKVSTTRGLETSDVATLGEHPPFNVANSLGQQDEYFEGVQREFQLRRFGKIGSESSGSSDTETENREEELPLLWPLDLLRLQLDEVWPSGAGLARLQGKPFSGGLPRIMKGPSRWKRGFIHVDEMGPLNSQWGLFSANIYLQLPQDSNSTVEKPQDMIHIWPLGIRTRWDWYRNAFTLSGLSSQDAEDQVRLRYLLGEPVTIACEPGDLVLLCVQRPHAAVGFSAGTRVSLQCFIQHKGPTKRLEIDS